MSPSFKFHREHLGMDGKGRLQNGHQLYKVDAPHEAIFITWTNVPTNLLETLASSMLKQIFEVITKNGGATYY